MKFHPHPKAFAIITRFFVNIGFASLQLVFADIGLVPVETQNVKIASAFTT